MIIWKFNIFALFEHAYSFGLKFCSYFKNNVLSDSILCIFIMMWLSTINFTPVSVKIKFLWSSENDWKFNIFALFEHAYSFGLKFCSYFKNNVLSDSFLWIFIMMWSSTMNFTPLSVKIKFLWSSENGWNISFWGKIVSFFLFWGCFSYIHRQIAIIFFLFLKIYRKRYIKMEYDQNCLGEWLSNVSLNMAQKRIFKKSSIFKIP